MALATPGRARAVPCWATDVPLLRPQMLLPRSRPVSRAFPFDHPHVQYVHFARNGIFALARQLGLSGGEVLLPAYFHGIEAEALAAAGVRARYFPVHAGMRVDPDEVVRCLTPDVRAIYLIHYAGFPAPVEALQQVCRDRGLLLIEDCALALLSRLGDRPLGSFGDASVFCLYKTLPTPDGGAVVLREGRLQIDGVSPGATATALHAAASTLPWLESQAGWLGRNLVPAVRTIGKAVFLSAKSEWVDVGTQRFNPADANLLMSSVSHAVLACQDFAAIAALRRRNYLHLHELLRDIAKPVFPELPDGTCPLFYPFATPHKQTLCARLNAKGIQAVDFWRAGELAPPRGAFPEVDELRDTIMEVPCHQDLSDRDVRRIAQTVRESVGELPR